MFLRTKGKHVSVRNGDNILCQVGSEFLYYVRRKFSVFSKVLSYVGKVSEQLSF